MPESDVRSVASALSSVVYPTASFMVPDVHKNHTAYQGWLKEGGGREEMNSSSAIRLVKTEETVSHRQNIGVKEEGTPSEFRSCVKVEAAILGSPS